MFIACPAKSADLGVAGWLFREGMAEMTSDRDLLEGLFCQIEGRVSLVIHYVMPNKDFMPIVLCGMYEDGEGGAQGWLVPHENIYKYGAFVSREVKKWLHFFNSYYEFDRVTIAVDAANAKSKRFVKLCGFVYSGQVEGYEDQFEEWILGDK